VSGTVVALCLSARHSFSKRRQPRFRLIAGYGVEGDAHAGETVQHRSRVARDPTQPNLRQVHLVQVELLEELRSAGFRVGAGDIGENITTRGVDLLNLPVSSRLRIGCDAVVQLTGLRNPCVQLDRFQRGLMSAVLKRGEDGELIRKAGVMAIVVASGNVAKDDPVVIELPPLPHQSLRVV
jgi:MOSC domain-containing protein YiiM